MTLPAPLAICGGCGVIAVPGRPACTVCGAAAAAAPIVAPAAAGDAVWACVVEADVLCRVCGMRTPLRDVGCAEELTCERCGQLQRFDAEQWGEGLDIAHKAAATCGPRAPNGAAARIGVDATTLERTQATTRIDGRGTTTLSLRVKTSPGHPLCDACRAPLVTERTPGAVATLCPTCNDRRAYALPVAAIRWCAALRGAATDDLRTDRARAVVQREASGLTALTCPNCGAGLALEPGQTMATCAHCKATSLVPRVAHARPGQAPVFRPFWLLFDANYAAPAADDEGDDEDGPPTAAPPPPTFSPRNPAFGGIVTAIGGVLFAIAMAVFAIVQSSGGCDPPKRRSRPRHGEILVAPRLETRA